MERREFITHVGKLIVLFPSLRLLEACGSSSTTKSGSNPPAGPTSTSSDRLTFTSSVVLSHSHTFDILLTALTAPPPEGLTGDTSITTSHTHVVTLTQADLQAMTQGQTVTKTTTTAVDPANGESHAHDFAFAMTPSGGGGGGGGTVGY